jgi:hypothetical protein
MFLVVKARVDVNVARNRAWQRVRKLGSSETKDAEPPLPLHLRSARAARGNMHPSFSQETKQHKSPILSFPFLHIVRLIVRALFWMLYLRNGMKFSARAAYATIAPAKSSLRGKKGPPLTLEHVGTLFIHRQKFGHAFSNNVFCSSCNEAGFWRCGEMLYALSTVRALSRFLGR